MSSERRGLVLLCTVSFFAFVSYDIARSPVLPLFARSLGAGPEAIGLAVGASTITGIALKFPAGTLADLIGRRRVLLFGAAVFGIMPFFYGLVHHYAALVAIRFLHGMATAVFAPVALTIVADLNPARRGENLAWLSTFSQAGRLLGPVLGGAILHATTFARTYFVSGLFGLVPAAALLAARWRPREPSLSRDPAPVLGGLWRGMREVGGDRGVLATGSIQAVTMLAVGVIQAFLPLYAAARGLNPAQIGLLFGAQALTTLLFRPMMGRLSDRVGRRPLIVWGAVICAAALGLFPAAGAVATLLPVAALFGLGESIVATSTSALVADLCHARSMGAAMGVLGTVMDIGHASGPVLGGLVVGAFGYASAFRAAGLALIAAALVFRVAVRTMGAGPSDRGRGGPGVFGGAPTSGIDSSTAPA